MEWGQDVSWTANHRAIGLGLHGAPALLLGHYSPERVEGLFSEAQIHEPARSFASRYLRHPEVEG
jgi:hypothetical protein